MPPTAPFPVVPCPLPDIIEWLSAPMLAVVVGPHRDIWRRLDGHRASTFAEKSHLLLQDPFPRDDGLYIAQILIGVIRVRG